MTENHEKHHVQENMTQTIEEFRGSGVVQTWSRSSEDHEQSAAKTRERTVNSSVHGCSE